MKKNEPSSVIQCSGLKKYYSGKTKALDGIDFNAAPGEFIAVMGASGSGKSTLLHLIAGLTLPTAGQIIIEGVKPAEMSDGVLTRFRRKRIGLVFQNFNLIPHLTAKENMMLPLFAESRQRKQAEERVKELAESLEITEQLDQYPDTLSGGQQQRVTLARALSLNPAIILADEPTGNLDTLSSRRICEIFKRLQNEEKRTILLVTHEPGVAIWSNRLLVLRDGKIISDTPTSQYREPHDLAAYYQKIMEQTSKKEEGAL